MTHEASVSEKAETADAVVSHSSSPLEIGDGNNNSKDYDTLRRTKHEPRWLVIIRYVSWATIATVLTLTCPGDTRLWVVDSASEPQWNAITVTLVLGMYVLVVAAFLVVHGSDPGYISAEMLANLHEEDDGLSLLEYNDTEEKKDEDRVSNHKERFDPLEPPSSQNTYDADASRNRTPPPPDEPADGVVSIFRGTRRKPCEICRFAPPLRSHHCKVCDRCVATFDHHCGLVGVCIGERNRGSFWWFLFLQATGFVTCSHVVGSSKLSWLTLLLQGDWSWDAARVLVAKVYLYPLTAVAIIMLMIHTFFALSNLTTFECSKGPRHLEYLKGTRDMDLPFSQGCIQNLRSFCCHRDAICCPSNRGSQQPWTPTLWQPPGKIIRDSEDWWEHPWQNKYWSCC